MAHVSEAKKKAVLELANLISEYPIIGAVNMENLPAPQLQIMRKQLGKSVVIKMSKRRLINIAIDQVKGKKGIDSLKEQLKGMPALIFTKDNPFKLYKTLQKNKSPAPAKAGQIAPNDIVIPAGKTPFAPGPVIGELGALGIKTGVDAGKVAIKEDKLVVKEGEEVQANVAEILTRLSIFPMEVGLDLVAVYEDGLVYDKKILAVDEQEYIDNITQASTWAMNLAMDVGFMTKDTVEPLICKAVRDAKSLALSQDFLADEVVEEILAKANGQANALSLESGYKS